jgi:hypothetical protein
MWLLCCCSSPMGGIKVVVEKEVDWEVRLEVSTEFCGCQTVSGVMLAVAWEPEAARPPPFPIR